jgi:hypothetical protein
MNRNYETEAIKLAKAIDIAIDAFVKYPPKDFTEEHIDHVVSVHNEWKNAVLNPEPKFKKIASLKYDIQNVFTYFQESSGETVEYFWRQIKNESLDYVREDKLRKIIERGKKGQIEFDLVTDSLVAAEQDGQITKEQAGQLSRMIGEFEKRGKSKK